MPTWDSDLYYRFRAQRTQPSIDLIRRIPLDDPGDVVDLGCGPGNSTAELRRRWPKATITGIDCSEEMLTTARASDSGVNWQLGDLATWNGESRYDVVFSNAALQWLPDHQTLLPRLFQRVNPSGVLAVQVPDHYDSALYRVLLEVSKQEAWSERMHSARTSLTRHPVGFYYDVLSPLTSEFELWTTEYQHVMESHQSILQFHRASGMRPYLEQLDGDEKLAFERQILAGYEKAFPLQADGRVLFPFRRLFFVARQPEAAT